MRWVQKVGFAKIVNCSLWLKIYVLNDPSNIVSCEDNYSSVQFSVFHMPQAKR